MSAGPKSAQTFSSNVPSFYVAGLGRGAIGFTTRSDIGPARPVSSDQTTTISTAVPTPSQVPKQANVFVQPNFGVAPVGYVAGIGRGSAGMGELARDQGELSTKQLAEAVGDGDRGDYSESNYDEFSGYTERLFASGVYDEDDKEADIIYDKVDLEMSSRTKRAREKDLLKLQTSKKISISEQFADLKRELCTVTAEEWDAIPEVGDHTLKYKQQKRKDFLMPTPDSLIEAASQRNGILSRAIDPNTLGTETSLTTGIQSVSTGLAGTRGLNLTSKLDKISDSVSGQTVVDPKGYLTSLNSIKITSDAEIGDIKKARALLSSVTSTNPRHAPGWISAARVEELAGNMIQARKIIQKGCEIIPESDDIWIEAARLHNPEEAKAVLAQAVKFVPNSVSLWIKAADLESDSNKKKIVYRRALEYIPNSVKLWKAAIELEDVVDARIMLARSVECCPQAVELWLALAKLETHENARKILNQAREANPTEILTWITAAKLEEAHGNGHLVDRIIEKMVSSLSQYQVVISRDTWIKEAQDCEHANAKLTCRAIIKNTIHLDIDDEDRKATWMDDAETCLARQPKSSVETARAIYEYALSVFRNNKSIWLAASVLEKQHGTPESLDKLLRDAVQHCSKAEVLWLLAAKEKWLQGNVPASRAILMEAFNANPHSEQIWLAAVKLEWENNEITRARLLLSKARVHSPTDRVWMKSALLERECGDYDSSLKLIDEGIVKYPTFAKFYMIAGQICDDDLHEFIRAREYYMTGLKVCPKSIPLWKLVVYLEEKTHGVNKARAMIELARLKSPNNEELLLENIRLERRHGNDKLAESLMAKALQDCPNSGILMAEDVLTCSKHQQKSKSVDALKKCDNDPHVIFAVARLFEKDNKVLKARKWFERAVTLAPRLGDAWAYFYVFELRQQVINAKKSAKEQFIEKREQALTEGVVVNGDVDSVLKRCVDNDPNRGELWCAITKTTALRRADIATKLKKVAEQLLAGNAATSNVTSNVTSNSGQASVSEATTQSIEMS